MKKFFEKYKDKIFIWICVCLIAVITFLVVLFQHLDVEKMENKESDITFIDNNLNTSWSIDNDGNIINNNYWINNNFDDYDTDLWDYDVDWDVDDAWDEDNSYLFQFYNSNASIINNYNNSSFFNMNIPLINSYSFNNTVFLYYQMFFQFILNDPTHNISYSSNYINISNLNSNFYNINYVTLLNNLNSNSYELHIPNYSYIFNSSNYSYNNVSFYFALSPCFDYVQDYLVDNNYNFNDFDITIIFNVDFLQLGNNPVLTSGINDTFYSSLNFNSLNASYTQLQSDYNTLLSNYNTLQNTYNTYVASHSYTDAQYNELNALYTQLQSDYNNLSNEYQDLLDTYNEQYQHGYNEALKEIYSNNPFYNAKLRYYFDLDTSSYWEVTITDEFLKGDTFINPVQLLKSKYSGNQWEAYVENTNLSKFVLIFDKSFPINNLKLLVNTNIANDFNYQFTYYFANDTTYVYQNVLSTDFYKSFTIDLDNINFDTSSDVLSISWYRQYSKEVNTISIDGYYTGFIDGRSSGFQEASTKYIGDIHEKELIIEDLNDRIDYLETAVDDSLNGLAFSMISGLMSSPFNILHDMLNFDFFGINLFGLFTSLLTFLIIIWVIKFLLGRK